MRIDSAGLVGIGTSAPTQSLEVAGNIQSTVNGTSSILALSGDNTNYSALRLRQSSTVSRLENLIAGTGAYTPIAINAGGSERIRVTTAGNVGIGTTTPTTALDVNGVASAVFFENPQTITASYTIASGKNAMSVGPVTVDAGATITVSAGARYVVI